jgi:CubicO group peptidase (beta-lactamase class C family)
VVEAVSGIPYVEYMQKHIFEPAGMKESGFPARDGSRPELAIGYTSGGPHGAPGGEQKPNLGMLPLRGCPAGSSSHTVEDMLRFDRALRSGKLLGPGWTGWMFTNHVPTPEERKAPVGYADGALGIAGGAPGVNAVLESSGRGAVIVLANLDPPIAGQVAGRLREAFGMEMD